MAKNMSDSEKKCILMLKGAQQDSEKFAVLFMVTKLIDEKNCADDTKVAIYHAIGAKFIKKLLTGKNLTVDCPSSVYRSVALSILNVFCQIPEVAQHPDTVSHVPDLLQILDQPEDQPDDNLLIVSETYSCLKKLGLFPPGREALHREQAVAKMCKIYAEKSFKTDEALHILVQLVNAFGPTAWDAADSLAFHAICNKIALDFETDRSNRQAELGNILYCLLSSCKYKDMTKSCKDESWPQHIYKGLRDIFGSKIVAEQRDSAFKLASIMFELLGAEWALADEADPKTFFLLLVKLASVELRMQLHGKKIDAVIPKSDVIISCLLILEISLSYLVTDSLDIDQKERQLLYTNFKEAFTCIIELLAAVSKEKEPQLVDRNKKLFVAATIRALSAWLAQETSVKSSQIQGILPFVLKVSNDSFYALRNEKLQTEKTDDKPPELDLLRLLLPPLCHLTVEEAARKCLLDNKQDEVLYDYFMYCWSIGADTTTPRRKKDAKPDCWTQEEKQDAKSAMVLICNILMNITVLEANLAKKSTVFISLLKFIVNNLPELRQNSDNLVLYGHMAVLGLLLLKQQVDIVEKNDYSICRYIQATIRFLWDAYIIDESNDPHELVVNISYKEHWLELKELWFLGMQTMSGMLQVIPWLSEFATESGWVEGIVETLKKVKVGGLQQNVKFAFEDILCQLVLADKNIVNVLKSAGALSMSKSHHMSELGKHLIGK